MNSLTVIILTFNEQIHIKRCIENLKNIADKIIIVDSYSTDSTVEIARSENVEVYQNTWVNYSNQFNWALQNCTITTNWIMRMDCDEYLTNELLTEINEKLPRASEATNGFIIKRRVIFMNRWIKHGGFYPHRLLRIWRTGSAVIEDRWMDEHVVLNGGLTESLEYDMVDHNLNSLSWWINKHNSYATREMLDLVNIKNKNTAQNNVKPTLHGHQFSQKRWLKEKVYSRIPLFVRPFCYFFYRYVLRLGFLDGKPGLIWHFLQGYWYRFLVDAKIYEQKIS